MSKEFKQIEKAPLYEMDKDGNIQKIDKKIPAIPNPRGSRNVSLWMEDGSRKQFSIDDLMKETFGEKEESQKEETGTEKVIDDDETILNEEENVESKVQKSERAKDTEQMPSSGKVISTKKKEEKKPKVEKQPKEKKVKKERKVSSDNPIIEKIMKLDCFESIKMWKLHQAGISNADITILVNDPHDFVVVKTLEKYKNNETLRNRAEKYKL